MRGRRLSYSWEAVEIQLVESLQSLTNYGAQAGADNCMHLEGTALQQYAEEELLTRFSRWSNFQQWGMQAIVCRLQAQSLPQNS